MPENKEQKATPITAETKKSTEPTKAEESKSPTGQKAKTTQEVTKPTGEAKPAPATEAKKPLEAPKPAPSTQAPTPPVDQKKVTKAPKSPGDANPVQLRVLHGRKEISKYIPGLLPGYPGRIQ